MSSSHRARVVVVGAGALGLAAAAACAARGWSVAVLDPGEPGGNASATAAGMIAPAFEAAQEKAEAGRADLYRRGRDLWPGFAELTGVDLRRDGADWVGSPEPLAGALRALGFAVEARPFGFHTPEDWLVDPVQALPALGAFVVARGGTVVPARARRIAAGSDGVRVETDDGAWRAEAVVLAAGWAAARVEAPGLAGALAWVRPIKGQILRLTGAGVGTVERVTRAAGVYVAPRHDSVVVGATMEDGICDRVIDPVVIERLRAAAVGAVPALAGAEVAEARAGVRGATPDGLPMVGATAAPGVFTALAPRRNGWLLAPLVGEAIACAIAGEPWADAETLRPDRFAGG